MRSQLLSQSGRFGPAIAVSRGGHADGARALTCENGPSIVARSPSLASFDLRLADPVACP